MKTPLSWLEDFVKINLPLSQLMWKMTEVGLTTESYEKIEGEIVLDCEVTPNRPDWMSIIGVAREIAAIQNTPLTLPKLNDLNEPTKKLPLIINNDFQLCSRYSALIIKNVRQEPSPEWMQLRLKSVGLRPINNLVDITNYVMFETGNPIHVFDYDKLHNAEMTLMKSVGGENFESVDRKTYSLPENAIIFKNGDKVIDLCGIKGGLNSGITQDTTTILILVAVYNGKLIRRTSQRLSLWSEASRIFERGANSGGTLDTLKRTSNLIQEIAGGEVASKLIDAKKESFEPRKLNLSLKRLDNILGINIPAKEVHSILKRLLLNPVLKSELVECTIPTYRGDLTIEEDLIEEVARIFGYNNFPKSLPTGDIPTISIPYFKDYRLDLKIKNLLTASSYCEIQTYSLISEDDLNTINYNISEVLRVDNPVSREFEYLRPNLKINLMKAMKLNNPNFENINIFEIGKVYLGKSLKNAKELYEVAGISNNKNYFEVKGLIERIFSDFHITESIDKYIEWNENFIYFSFPFNLLMTDKIQYRQYIPIPKYPPIIEDMAFIIPVSAKVSEIIDLIKKQSLTIANVELYDKFQNTKTFRITYLNFDRNLTTSDVAPVREKITKALQKKNVMLK